MSVAATHANAPRSRRVALAAMDATMALGLASRRGPDLLPAALGKCPGDALWALMVSFGWRAFRPRARIRDVTACAMATSTVVEFAKLWQTPWLVAFRHTRVGRLLLGHVFSWQNLMAHGVGVMAGVALDRLVSRRLLHTTTP